MLSSFEQNLTSSSRLIILSIHWGFGVFGFWGFGVLGFLGFWAGEPGLGFWAGEPGPGGPGNPGGGIPGEPGPGISGHSSPVALEPSKNPYSPSKGS